MPRKRQSIARQLKIARRVTRKHGEIFAAEWFPSSYGGEDVWDAFAQTGLMAWPDDDPSRPLGWPRSDPRQDRYQDIEDEILKRTFEAVVPAIAEAFVKVATEVLDRERDRDSRPEPNGEWSAVYVATAQGNIVGYIEEMPGALAQGATVEETETNLREALAMMLRANRRTTWEDFKGERVVKRERLSFG